MDEVLYEDEPQYDSATSIEVSALRKALCDLCLLGDDPFLSGQAFNLAIVDKWLMELEEGLQHKLITEDQTPTPEIVFLSAQTQMWIFAVYELLRTWRKRAKDMCNWESNGGLQMKLEELNKDREFVHFGRKVRASQIQKVINKPDFINSIKEDLERTYISFTRIEAIRISLAKHEVRKRKNAVAMRPGYGWINKWCGALEYEIEIGGEVLGVVNRRDIAEDIRSFPSILIPSDQERTDFDAFMRGPNSIC